MFHREEGGRGFLVSSQSPAGLLDAFPCVGESRVGPAEGVLGVDRSGQGVGGEPVVDGDLGGRQGRAPELDLIERAVAEASIAGA